MFTVSAPKSPWLGRSKTETLRQALKRKYAWEKNQPGTSAIIENPDGYIVSIAEQAKLLVSLL